MRTLLPILAAFTIAAGTTFGQTQQVKMLSGPDPVFPAEAKNEIYGDELNVVVEVEKTGKVKTARVFGPLVPCSELDDPAVETIRGAAETAIKATLFEPILDKNGKPMSATLQVSYKLRTTAGALIVQAGLVNGKALKLPKPNYPQQARVNLTSGSVEVRVLIAEDGAVLSAGQKAGHRDLAKPSIEAACAARFSPTTLNGRPIRVSGMIKYAFHL